MSENMDKRSETVVEDQEVEITMSSVDVAQEEENGYVDFRGIRIIY